MSPPLVTHRRGYRTSSARAELIRKRQLVRNYNDRDGEDDDDDKRKRYTCGPASCEPSWSPPLPRMGGRRAAGGRQTGGRRAVSPRFREWPLCVCVWWRHLATGESHQEEGERERSLAGVSRDGSLAWRRAIQAHIDAYRLDARICYS